ncbi:MAG: hypothetical protein FWG50_13890, partial [Kiritimatiellaeota bacterium]|nr:hypothetical protein [Kiritimatiellota bacterium]
SRAPDGLDVFPYPFPPTPAARDVFFGVVRADALRAPPAAWTTAGTRVVRDTPLGPTTSTRVIEAPLTGPQGFMRLRIRYE